MKLAQVRIGGDILTARIEGDQASPLKTAPFTSLKTLMARYGGALTAALDAEGFDEPVRFQPQDLVAPITMPRKILGIGLNYKDHARETGREPPTTQTWFNKQVTAVNPPFAPVHLPRVSSALDYEVELVAVIGTAGRHISEADALSHVAGYMVGCDVSVRDWQKATPSMIMGKGFDTHAPIGPWMTTIDEVGDISALRLQCHVNGELRQNGTAGDMVHTLPAQIAHLSKAFTLEPGDLIFTGTPAGVGVAFDPPKFLRTGDVVSCEIDHLGAFTFEVIDEPVPGLQ